MKFTDGYWMLQPGVEALRARHVEMVDATDSELTAYVAIAPQSTRGNTLNMPQLTATFSSPMPDVIGVKLEHYQGRVDPGPHFELFGSETAIETAGTAQAGEVAKLTSGNLSVEIPVGGPWNTRFVAEGKVLTSSDDRGFAALTDADDKHYMREQLIMGVGEHVFGLGERFGPYVKNGQSVDIWNADGGTASEQAYKNIPFYMTDAGYGVFVDHPELVSFEVASEAVTRTQFSVEGQRLKYYLIYGPSPKEILDKYTALTGRPARVPAWASGLWLSTSFTTSYDEATVTSFIEGMAERDIPLSVFHFDCFWMRQFHWSDFTWDPVAFPDPEGLLSRLHERGLKVSAWINPYIAQRSVLFNEGKEKGYLVKTADGSVWQWDLWQAGMALVDFTNPEAYAWYQGKIKNLLGQGVDSVKTDFGERIPTDVVWHDGSDPQSMHNYYVHLYNKAVFDAVEEVHGKGEAVLFARSATAGGQQFPVHWGGDCESTFVAMAESLRGGLSLSLSGFGYWSHDIGGFEGDPDPAIFKRWLAFGLLSSHSRLHGSDSYRVPWAFDEEAVDVARKFTKLKLRLMPYLREAGEQAHQFGTPVMRPMLLEFPEDRSARVLDTQYMLGGSLLVAPVFSESTVEFYVPEGTWTNVLSGEQLTGPRWYTQEHGYDSVPLLARPGSVIPVGAQDSDPEYAWLQDVTLYVHELADGQVVEVAVPRGAEQPDEYVTFQVERSGTQIVATGPADSPWSVQLGGVIGAGQSTAAVNGRVELSL